MSARLNRSADVAAGDWLTGFSSLFGAGDCFGVGVVAVTGAGSVGAVFITGGWCGARLRHRVAFFPFDLVEVFPGTFQEFVVVFEYR